MRNGCSDCGCTAAAEAGDAEAVAALLAASADLNAKDNDGRTPLQRAAKRKKRTKEASVKGRVPPLHKAALQGDTATIAALLDADADPNARAKCRRSPLHEAASWGHAAAIAALRDASGDVKARTWFGQPPLYFAAAAGHTAAVAALRAAGARE